MKQPNDLFIKALSGVEGPKEDPYAWTLWDVRLTNKWRVKYRESALGGSYVKVYNAAGCSIAEVTGEAADVQRYFEKIVGHSVYQLNEWWFEYNEFDAYAW